MYRNGGLKQPYEGDNTKEAILSFLRNPDAPPVPKPKEADWSEEPSQVVHLTTDTFQEFIQVSLPFLEAAEFRTSMRSTLLQFLPQFDQILLNGMLMLSVFAL